VYKRQLLSHAPESSDAEFTWDNFQTSVNKDLADVLGNLVSRITKFARSKFGALIPDGGHFTDLEGKLMEDLEHRLRTYEALMDAMEVRKAAAELRAIWVTGNEYLQTAAPWTVMKTHPDQAAAIVRLSFSLIRLYAVLSRPFIPDAAEAMMAALRCQDWTWPESMTIALQLLPSGQPFSVPENLFRKITDEERADWQVKFAGVRT
jgi:methionyl-tRNA synthetase